VLKQFEINIHKNNLFNKTDKLLIAFSGGVDSVVLCDLLTKAGYHFDLAHCNFQLRGTEANDDTSFCETYAKLIHAKCHTIYFNTKNYAVENKLSIQMAARELRYKWFKELISEHGYTYLLTAHHANDNAETLFVNLTRGTGIKGLQGIPEKQNNTIRPLLFATKEMIKNYAKKHNIQFREDSSNQEVKYKRNFIRHQIIPELKKLNPILEETLNTSIHYFKQSSQIVTQFCKSKFKDICEENNERLKINISLLLSEPQKETLLFEWLHPKGFKANQIEQLIIVLSDKNNVGKFFESSTHQLAVDRTYLIVKKKTNETNTTEFKINSISDTTHLPIKLVLEEIKQTSFTNNKNELFISVTDHFFPLTLRKWKTGDKFQPFGMNGFKKLSDYFKDQKLSKFDKEAVWILESNQQIICIVGYRMDNRFKVTNESNQILKLTSFID
jgi:tRNA(Ile)-lysidine synthase